MGRHEWQVGFYGFHQQDDQALGLVFNDAGSPDFSVGQRPSGGRWPVFAPDTFRIPLRGERDEDFQAGMLSGWSRSRAPVRTPSGVAGPGARPRLDPRCCFPHEGHELLRPQQRRQLERVLPAHAIGPLPPRPAGQGGSWDDHLCQNVTPA